jgi:hypothetical protein
VSFYDAALSVRILRAYDFIESKMPEISKLSFLKSRRYLNKLLHPKGQGASCKLLLRSDVYLLADCLKFEVSSYEISHNRHALRESSLSIKARHALTTFEHARSFRFQHSSKMRSDLKLYDLW